MAFFNSAKATSLETQNQVLKYFNTHQEEPTLVMISSSKANSYEKDKKLFSSFEEKYPTIHFVEINTKDMVAFNQLDAFKPSYLLINHNKILKQENVDSAEKLTKIISKINN